MAGNFRRKKNICGFVAICYSFLHEIWDHWHLWWHLWAIRESFLLQKFAAKVSRYMHGSWNIIGWKGWTITTVLYSYNLTRTVTFGRVSEVSNTRRVTSGGVWNVDPWLLWLFNCVIKRRGLDMWESVRNLPCCAPLVFSLFEAHDSLCLLNVGEAWMTALVVCTLSHLLEIKRFQWMSTACIRQPLSLTPTLNSMLHITLWWRMSTLWYG